MKIVLVCDSIIPPKFYGGTERVVWYLGKELADLGHEVTFVAQKGTYSNFAKVIETDPATPIAAQIPDNCDIVHFQNNVPAGIKKPYVVTIHGNNQGVLDKNAIFVSHNHAMRHNSESFVYNGLDWSDYSKPILNKKRDHFHFLGKASWKVKNIRGAVDIIKKNPSEKLYVLGGYRLNFKSGFRCTLTPKARFFGMVGGSQKDDLIMTSKGLIFPAIWHEPFGLALVESLYFGTPVFGTPVGSLLEIVTPEVGILSSDLNVLADSLSEAGNFSAQICSEYARSRFNAKNMAESYLLKYEQVLNGRSLNETNPELTILRYDGISITPVSK